MNTTTQSPFSEQRSRSGRLRDQPPRSLPELPSIASSRAAAPGSGADDLMLSPAQIAERVGVSIDAVRRAIRAGHLPASKVFGRVRVHLRDLERYIDDHAMAPDGALGGRSGVGRRAPAALRGSLRAHL